MAQTLKNIQDSIFEIATRFSKSDEFRGDEDWLNYKINQVRAQLINQDYMANGVIKPEWLSDVGILTFYKVSPADDWSVTCSCQVGKSTIPQVITLNSPDGNLDLGVYSLISTCGTKVYTRQRMSQWSWIPPEHTYSNCQFYDRVNTALYTNTPDVTKLKFIGILLDPIEGKLINSAPIASGSIVSGTVYYVSGGQVIYRGVTYQSGQTFTGGATATYTGNGTVYLNTTARAYLDTDPYPASADMIRQIEIEILTKEFNIEMKAIPDLKNDSVDDAKKAI